MKKMMMIATAVIAGGASAAVYTTTNFDIRSSAEAAGAKVYASGLYQGAGSKLELTEKTDYCTGLGATGYETPKPGAVDSGYEVKLRMTGIDVDGNGVSEDYLDFSITYSTSDGSKVYFNNQGLQSKDWSGDLIATIKGGSAFAMIDGTAHEYVDGIQNIYFTGAGLGAAFNSAGSFDGAVNGSTLTIATPSTYVSGYKYYAKATDFAEADWTDTLTYSADDPKVFTRGLDIRVDVIPEPATFGLLGLAGAGLVAFRRRSRS